MTLSEHLKAKNLKEHQIIQIIHELLTALFYLHDLRLVHRDIKPTNIMLRKKLATSNEDIIFFGAQYELVLLDFGLCTRTDDHSPTSFLNDRSGTVGYLAPELIQKMNDDLYDEKVDIYSLGILMIELLTGSNPFKCGDYKKSMINNYEGIVDLQSLKVKSDTLDFIQKCIVKQPYRRVSAEEALEHIIFTNIESDFDVDCDITQVSTHRNEE